MSDTSTSLGGVLTPPTGSGAGRRLLGARARRRLVLGAADATAAATMVTIAAGAAAGAGYGAGLLHWYPVIAAAAAAALLAASYRAGLYDTAGTVPVERFRRRVLAVSVMPLPALAFVVVLGGPPLPSAAVLGGAWLLLAPLAGMVDAVARQILVATAAWSEAAVVIGSGPAVTRLVENLLGHPELGLRPVGYVGAPADVATAPSVPFLGPLETVAEHRGLAETALVVLSPDMVPPPPGSLPFRRVLLVPELAGAPSLWIGSRGLGDTAALEFLNRSLSVSECLLKRACDLMLAVPALIASLPLLLLLAALIRMTSQGPALYVQPRVGFRGETVRILKLRTMFRDADARLLDLLARDPAARDEWSRHMKLSRDPRVLPLIGNFLRRSSLDELPQLWNVVRGEMSLVGPRPFPAYHVERFSPEFQRLRASVRPGLTGLWQVSVRSNGDLRQQEVIDTYYVRNWSLWLDLYIVLNTVPVLLTMRGAR